MSQQDTVTFIIDEQGECVYLMTEAAPDIMGAIVRRGSYIEPVNALLRVLFHLLRSVVGDKGRMSDFTRAWPCQWRINMKPVDGGILPVYYYNRQAAIEAEVDALNKLFQEKKI